MKCPCGFLLSMCLGTDPGFFGKRQGSPLCTTRRDKWPTDASTACRCGLQITAAECEQRARDRLCYRVRPALGLAPRVPATSTPAPASDVLPGCDCLNCGVYHAHSGCHAS